MDINPEDYTRYTQGLTPGMSIKVPHLGCSESKAMKITENVEGTLYKCFKCGAYIFGSSFNSPRERLRRQETYEATKRIQADVSYDLPVDFSQSLPPRGLAWVGQGGLTLEMQKKYRIGWSQELNRVVLPVNNAGYTARAVELWQQPKYLEKVPRGTIWESQTEDNKSGKVNRKKSCVICEDILSAIRCGEFIKSYALLGTSLSTNLLMTFSEYKKVKLWLDPDKGGKQGVVSMINRLRLVCDDVQIIDSDTDPKHCTNNEIRRRLILN